MKLRERYNNFLSDVYNPNDIEARSTDIPRAKMSLNLVLAGLYPPAKSQQWHPDINWQPIATTSVPIAQDDFFVPIVASNRLVTNYCLDDVTNKTYETIFFAPKEIRTKFFNQIYC